MTACPDCGWDLVPAGTIMGCPNADCRVVGVGHGRSGAVIRHRRPSEKQARAAKRLLDDEGVPE